MTAIRSASADVASELDSWIAQIRDIEQIPGVAVAVVQRGKPAIIRGYGVRQLGKPGPVDEHTLFGLASVTKAFTALAVAKLIDRGAVSWDGLAQDYLPIFRVADPYVSANATVRDLLAHRTGTVRGDILWFGNSDAQGAELVRLYSHLPQERTFRQDLSYSNLMYTAAGEIVTRAGGKSWEVFLQDEILSPLGMKETLANRDQLAKRKNVSGLHAYDGQEMVAFETLPVTDNTAPAGGLYSSAYDLMHWLEFWLSDGKLPNGDALISPETYRELVSLQTLMGTRSAIDNFLHDTEAPFGYGLGWFIGEYRGRHVLTHLGGGDGLAALISLMPEAGIGVAVLANAEGSLGRVAIRNLVLDTVLEEETGDTMQAFETLLTNHRQQSESLASVTMQSQRPDAGPRASSEAYVGTYRSDIYGNVRISADGPTLNAALGNKRNYALRHWSGDRFQLLMPNPAFNWPVISSITFGFGADGEPDSLTLQAAGQSAHYTRLSQ